MIWPFDLRHVQFHHGPRQGHVQQAAIFGIAIPFVGLPRLVIGRQIKNHLLIAVAIGQVLADRSVRKSAGQKDDRKLQPLAGVDGHDLHLGALSLDGLQIVLLGLAAFGLEHIEHAEQVEVLRISGLFESGHNVTEVGQPPLAVELEGLVVQKAGIFEQGLKERPPALFLCQGQPVIK